MEVVVIVVLAVGGAAFVALSLRDGSATQDASTHLNDLNERRRAALEALVDLENENSVGKLSDDDLAELRPRYEAEALAVIDELESFNGGSDPLEKEIESVRARLERDR